MTNQDVTNKRKSARHLSSETIYVSCGNETIKGEMKDISLYGMRFAANRKIPENMVIGININYYPVNFIQRGWVVWSKTSGLGWEYGVEFINISSVHNLLLEDLMQKIILDESKGR